MEIKEVLTEWRTLAKIAELLHINEDDVWDTIFKGRKIYKKKIYTQFSCITLYKEEVSELTVDN